MTRNKLSSYRAKRNFGKTAEPTGKAKVKPAEHLRYVIQKHAARRLHYDFRLDLALQLSRETELRQDGGTDGQGEGQARRASPLCHSEARGEASPLRFSTRSSSPAIARNGTSARRRNRRARRRSSPPSISAMSFRSTRRGVSITIFDSSLTASSSHGR